MDFLIPDIHKIRIMILIMTSIWAFITLSEFMAHQRDVSVEELTMPLGGEKATNGKELNQLYVQVGENTRALPKEQ